MMAAPGRLTRLKPAAPRHAHLLLAAATWTVVGTMLSAFGLHWFFKGQMTLLLPAVAVAAGLVKAFLVLRPAATRIVDRIMVRGEGRCIGGFFSWRTWILVAAMMAAGWVLRAVSLPPEILGLIYLAIGSALLTASGFLWRAWRGIRARPGPGPA